MFVVHTLRIVINKYIPPSSTIFLCLIRFWITQLPGCYVQNFGNSGRIMLNLKAHDIEKLLCSGRHSPWWLHCDAWV